MKLSFFLTLMFFAQAFAASEGGSEGGGAGSEEAKVFSKVANRHAQLLVADAKTKPYGDQLVETLKNVEIYLVPSLSTACDGRAKGSEYAYSCPGKINLLKSVWANEPEGKGWLSDVRRAETHWDDILHEVFRAGNRQSPHFVTDDAGYSVVVGELGVKSENADPVFANLRETFKAALIPTPQSLKFGSGFVCFARFASETDNEWYRNNKMPFGLSFHKIGSIAVLRYLYSTSSADAPLAFLPEGLIGILNGSKAYKFAYRQTPDGNIVEERLVQTEESELLPGVSDPKWFTVGYSTCHTGDNYRAPMLEVR